MPAPKGNQFWKERSSHGRNPLFDTPEQLEDACEEYFQWVDENPLSEEKAFSYQGEIFKDTISKMRAMTIKGLCIFLDIDQSTWENYRIKEDFIRVTSKIENIIYDQKFSGAAADLLNANIIARDLGLKDQASHEHTGPDGGPIENINVEVSEEDAVAQYLLMIKKP